MPGLKGALETARYYSVTSREQRDAAHVGTLDFLESLLPFLSQTSLEELRPTAAQRAMLAFLCEATPKEPITSLGTYHACVPAPLSYHHYDRTGGTYEQMLCAEAVVTWDARRKQVIGTTIFGMHELESDLLLFVTARAPVSEPQGLADILAHYQGTYNPVVTSTAANRFLVEFDIQPSLLDRVHVAHQFFYLGDMGERSVYGHNLRQQRIGEAESVGARILQSVRSI